jgi:Phosphoinositide phospholipase C, Ca2+-dependent
MRQLAFLPAAVMAAALVVSAASGQSSERLRINQIQVLGTHNSYSQGTDPRILAALDAAIGPRMDALVKTMSPAAKADWAEYHPNSVAMSEALNYRFPPLAAQLDAGLRSLEIDIHNDPDGGRFLRPAAYDALGGRGELLPLDQTDMEKPGFKVLHMVDVDVRSSCNLFVTCLTQLKQWSDAHPKHEPIFILLETKNDTFPIFPGSTSALPFDANAFARLDADILRVLGRDHVIAPDDVRGNFKTLEAAVRAGNWPTLKAARGKFVFLMLTAIDTAGLSAYREGRPNLEGRVAFLRSKPGDSFAAFLLLDNATYRLGEVAKRVREGYLVRSRADIETYEAKVNDLSRAVTTFASGAQIVSTDFFAPGNSYGTDYVVRLPGGGAIRCNPVNAPQNCDLGTKIR